MAFIFSGTSARSLPRTVHLSLGLSGNIRFGFNQLLRLGRRAEPCYLRRMGKFLFCYWKGRSSVGCYQRALLGGTLLAVRQGSTLWALRWRLHSLEVKRGSFVVHAALWQYSGFAAHLCSTAALCHTFAVNRLCGTAPFATALWYTFAVQRRCGRSVVHL